MGQGSSANVIAPPTSPASRGAIGPRRSEKRPASGLTIASNAAREQPDRADRRRRRAELVEPQRAEHAQGSEQQARDRHQQQAGADPAVAERAHQAAQRAVAERLGRRRAQRSRSSGRRRSRRSRRTRPRSRSGRRRRRSRARAARPRSRRPSPSRSAARASQAEPRRPASPSRPPSDAAPPTPWTKRARSSTRMLDANATAMLERTMSASPVSTVGRTPTARRHPAARKAADERPDRIGGGKDAGAGLGQAELLRQVGQQRRDRRVERRVDEDDSGDEEKEFAHRTAAMLGLGTPRRRGG